jgi:hypothetical protein
MEHPEKALFDEVRGLRNQLEEAKERLVKIENDYNEKVLAYETRKTINDRLENKIEHFLKDSQKVTLIVNGKEYPFLRSFFTQNLIQVNFLTNDDRYELDMGKGDLKGLLSILRNGNNYFNFDKTDIPRKMQLDNPKQREDNAFISIIRNHMTEDSFEDVLKRFDLVYSYISDEKNIIENIIVETPFVNSKLDVYMAKQFDDIINKDQVSHKAYFINSNGKIDFILKSRIRINKIGIRAFHSSPSNWIPSNGKTVTKIYVSLDGIKWDFVKNVPATYGEGKEITIVSFDRLITFKYLRFQADSSHMFSLNYITFKK